MFYGLLHPKETENSPIFPSKNSLRKTTHNCSTKFETPVPFACAAESIRKTLASPGGDKIIPKTFIKEAQAETGECKR